MTLTPRNFEGDFDALAVTVTVCSALSLYNALELLLLILTTFHVYRGLYFWSLLAASFGIIPYTIGFMLEYFELTSLAAGIAVDSFGWVLMVTGQSVVLYSRLYLVLGRGHRKLLNVVKWMIIIDGLLFHFLTIFIVYGKNYGKHKAHAQSGYEIIERFQMTGFTLQEFFLSGLYVWKTLDIFKAGEKKRSHRLMWQLFSINVIIIILDIGLLTIEYLNFSVLEQTLKGVTYSIKLKLELAILNKLVELSQSNQQASNITVADAKDFLGNGTKPGTGWDVTRFRPPFSRSSHSDPKWMEDLEKSGIQHVEAAYSPTDFPRRRVSYADAIPEVETESEHDEIRPMSDPSPEKRRKGSESELLYADAVRRLAR